VRAHALYLPILSLVLFGAFTKSAQFPFHFWLPGAMEAPTPVSAYLHSATMVKAGVFLLARLSPALGGTDEWLYVVTTVGAVTMLVGGLLALYQTDLKLILAYSTVSALGTLVALLGLGTTYAIKAAVVFLLAHALYKGALFMIAGAVDHETGGRDVERLGGLRRKMPITAGVALLASVSLAGFGPVLSFIGKELLLEAVLESGRARLILTPVAVLTGALFVAVAGIVGVRPFFGARAATPREAHEAPLSLWGGPAALAALGLLIGVAPALAGRWLVAPSVASVLGRGEPVELALWHGFNPALALSVVSVALGLAVYFGWAALRRRTASAAEKIFVWGPARWYGLILDGAFALATWQTRLLQNGHLRFYVLVVIAATAASRMRAATPAS
jgi:multicomponent Na+:H+ antiporter subunit A